MLCELPKPILVLALGLRVTVGSSTAYMCASRHMKNISSEKNEPKNWTLPCRVHLVQVGIAEITPLCGIGNVTTCDTESPTKPSDANGRASMTVRQGRCSIMHRQCRRSVRRGLRVRLALDLTKEGLGPSSSISRRRYAVSMLRCHTQFTTSKDPRRGIDVWGRISKHDSHRPPTWDLQGRQSRQTTLSVCALS